MKPNIEMLPEKKLIGQKLKMSLKSNTTHELWKSFMPRRHEIKNALGSELYSLQVYSPDYFSNFNLAHEFEKWAAIQVSSFDSTPDGMETMILTGGLYAIFYYKGLSTDTKIFENIFKTWLPKSNYVLDQRPHFEVLGEKYKNNDANSEEEIWIPIRRR